MKDLLTILTSKLDTVIAFISGDVLATYLSLYFLPDFDWIHPTIKLIVALLVGIFGGIGGLLGKDLYEVIKKQFKRKKSRNDKRVD